jgi:amino acid permease
VADHCVLGLAVESGGWASQADILILYLLYMFGYAYIALFGFLGAVFIKEHLEERRSSAKLVSMAELSRVGALWVLNSGLASVAMEVITK